MGRNGIFGAETQSAEPGSADFDPLEGGFRGNLIRMRTMIVLRWIAIIGQLTAIEVAQRLYNLQLELGLCYLTVGISVVANLLAMFLYPENKRLSEAENLLMFLFDILQLSFLLYLTGGLHNPFALLILGPVTLSAATLSTRSTLFLAAVAVAMVSVLAEYHLLLRTEQGFILRMPDIFVFGSWAAIIIGLLFLSISAHRVTSEMNSMSDALQATHMALAREQKLTDLGGVVAAAAHELGTPLATIKLTSSELIEDLENHPELREDAELIRDQADRCRDILQSMGRAGKEDTHLRQGPLSAVLREAAEPHMNRGKQVTFLAMALDDDSERQPTIFRQPALVHGLRNLIQNAVDFADSRVWIEAQWSSDHIILRILDDGPGFPVSVLGRIGDPFVRRRRPDRDASRRPEYKGMGLGLFIAKTLLERTGAELSFANGTDPFLQESERAEKSGAVVEVVWERAAIESTAGRNQGLADNIRIAVQ